jgi:hypothetical protein
MASLNDTTMLLRTATPLASSAGLKLCAVGAIVSGLGTVSTSA